MDKIEKKDLYISLLNSEFHEMLDFWRVNTLVILKLQIAFCMFSAFNLRNDSTFEMNENSWGRFLNADFWKTRVSLQNRTHKFFSQIANFAKLALRRSNYEYPQYKLK